MEEFKHSPSQKERESREIARKAAKFTEWAPHIAVVEEIPSDSRCPACGRLVLQQRGWVINYHRDQVICFGCYQQVSDRHEIKDIAEYDVVLFQPFVRYVLDDNRLTAILDHLGVNRTEFSTTCGWSRSYLRSLEQGRQNSMSVDAVKIILGALQKHGFHTGDRLS